MKQHENSKLTIVASIWKPQDAGLHAAEQPALSVALPNRAALKGSLHSMWDSRLRLFNFHPETPFLL